MKSSCPYHAFIEMLGKPSISQDKTSEKYKLYEQIHECLEAIFCDPIFSTDNVIEYLKSPNSWWGGVIPDDIQYYIRQNQYSTVLEMYLSSVIDVYFQNHPEKNIQIRPEDGGGAQNMHRRINSGMHTFFSNFAHVTLGFTDEYPNIFLSDITHIAGEKSTIQKVLRRAAFIPIEQTDTKLPVLWLWNGIQLISRMKKTHDTVSELLIGCPAVRRFSQNGESGKSPFDKLFDITWKLLEELDIKKKSTGKSFLEKMRQVFFR